MVFAQAADVCCAKHLRLNVTTSHGHDWNAYETSLSVHLFAYETPCDDNMQCTKACFNAEEAAMACVLHVKVHAQHVL